MLTLKFGGTSMGSARRILNSADIVSERARTDRVSVIVSAVSGVSNTLERAIKECERGKMAVHFVSDLRCIHRQICLDVQSALIGFNAKGVMESIEGLFDECEKLLEGIAAFGECPDTVHCRVMGMGERLVSPIMEAVLRAKGENVMLLDSREYIFTHGNQKEGDADYEATAERLNPFCDGRQKDEARILLFTGFVCSWIGGSQRKPLPGLLGRNGSDFSASIIGASLNAKKVEFWTDVDGIYTADPRIVRDALLISDMSYEEAMELSFFGSKALHPKTLSPLAAKGIEAWSLNSMNRSSHGTRIGHTSSVLKDQAVRGISCLKDTAMISVSGSGMKGKAGMAGRVFAAISRAAISILLITQSSSEYTISFCVRDENALASQDALEGEFALEIKSGVIDPIVLHRKCAIVSIVGDGMIEKQGVAGRFFDSLASYNINILAIAQGSSERCISTVIQGEYGDMAVRAAHLFFFHTARTIDVFLFGAGTIGIALLRQINAQKQKLLFQGIEVNVIAIATSKHLLLDSGGIALDGWQDKLAASKLSPNLDEVLEFAKKMRPLNPVFVDCTASSDLPKQYTRILESGMHIVTPNKRANSMDMAYYHRLRHVALNMHRRFLYETNVGAGLPIIDTLQNLFKSGDTLTGFSGIMSGSLSYIFGRLDDKVPFSLAVAEAKEKGLTEPDPRDDLSGMDVARKALIIAREAGMEMEMSDIKMKSVFPKDFDTSGSADEFLKRLHLADEYFKNKADTLKKSGAALRMGASIKDGKCSVGILEVSRDDPLYDVKGGENAFVFHTERYSPIPLTVRGYGAGADVTAAGVFGDMLRTVSVQSEHF